MGINSSDMNVLGKKNPVMSFVILSNVDVTKAVIQVNGLLEGVGECVHA